MKKILIFLVALVTLAYMGCEKPKEDAKVTQITLRDRSIEVNVGSTSPRIKYVVEPEELQDVAVLTWSSDNESIATVDERGRVTGVAEGRTKVWAKCDTVSASISVIVLSVPVENFMIQESIVIPRDNLDTLKVTDIKPTNADINTIEWEIENPEIASYSIENDYLLISGLKEGSTKIVGKCDDIERVCNITVEYFEVEGFTLKAESDITYVGGVVRLLPTFTPQNVSNKSLTWEVVSGAECIRFDENTYEVKALKEGSVTIKATTYNGFSDEVEISIDPVVASEVKLTYDASIEYYEGDTIEINSTVLPSYYFDAGKKLTWKVNSGDGVATINPSDDTSSATLIVIKKGTMTVTATAENDVYGECSFEVYSREVPNIVLVAEQKELYENQSTTIKANLFPDIFADENITWSVKTTSTTDYGKTTITPSEDGRSATLYAYSVGTVTVSVTTMSGGQATCEVNVIKPELTAFEIIEPSGVSPDGTFGYRQQRTIKYKSTPQIDNLKISWKSSNSDVAIIDEKGELKAVGHGVTMIIATAYGFSDTVLARSYSFDKMELAIAFKGRIPWEGEISSEEYNTKIKLLAPLCAYNSTFVYVYDKGAIYAKTKTNGRHYTTVYCYDEVFNSMKTHATIFPQNSTHYEADWTKEQEYVEYNKAWYLYGLEENFAKNYAKTHKELITNLKVNYKYNYYNIDKTYVVPITYRQLGVLADFGREYSKDIASIVQSSSDEVVVMRLSYSDYLSGKYDDMRFRIAPIYGENTDCPYLTNAGDYIWYSEIKSSSGKPVIENITGGGNVVFNGTIYAGNEYKMVCDDLPGKCFYLKFVL